jgi:hypothetical protein
LRVGVKHFVELARATIDENNVAVTAALLASLDGYVRRNGVWPGVAFVVVVKVYGDELLVAGDDGVGDADRFVVVQAGAEVGMEMAIKANTFDEVSGVGVNRQLRDVGVPDVVGGEEWAADDGRGVGWLGWGWLRGKDAAGCASCGEGEKEDEGQGDEAVSR